MPYAEGELLAHEFHVPVSPNDLQMYLDRAIVEIAEEQGVGTHIVAEKLVVSVTATLCRSGGTNYTIFYRKHR